MVSAQTLASKICVMQFGGRMHICRSPKQSMILTSYRCLVSLLLEIGSHKGSLLLGVRVSTVIAFKASIFTPVVPKIKPSVVVAAILKVNELHGGGIHLALLQCLQFLASLSGTHFTSLHWVVTSDCSCFQLQQSSGHRQSERAVTSLCCSHPGSRVPMSWEQC